VVERLTTRECDVLRLMCRGMTNKEIAQELCVTLKTVEYHVTNILGKLGVANRTEAAVWGLAQGLVGPSFHDNSRQPGDDKD
jgi:NarL family two-component system response regulator LiaR